MAKSNAARSHEADSAQILLFPGERKTPDLADAVAKPQSGRGTSVVLCGTYRKDPDGLRRTFECLKDTGFSVLSPSNPFIESEDHGFVYMKNEGTLTPEQIEYKHLNAIQQADFIWFFAPGGYVGPTGALEVGFARANGIPIFSDTKIDDMVLKEFIEVVASPKSVLERFRENQIKPPSPAIATFQHYYKRAAIHRGYNQENAKDCLLLMVEEFGEFARALRKREHLTRHGKEITNNEALELADIFIYIVHMANILKIDLSAVVQMKELLNIQRFINGK